MKQRKRKKYFVLCAVMVLYVMRVCYVTAENQYETEWYDIGDEIAVKGYTVSVKDVETYRFEDFFLRYPELKDEYYSMMAVPGYHIDYLMVCTLDATCNDETQDYDFTANVVNIAHSARCADSFVSEALSERTVFFTDEDKKVGNTVQAKVIYPIQNLDLSEKQSRNFDDLKLTLQVSSYPVKRLVRLGRVTSYLQD